MARKIPYILSMSNEYSWELRMNIKTSEEIEQSEVYKHFVTLCKNMKNKSLGNFLMWWLCPFSDIGSKYFTAPGSRRNHHAFIGGLAFHSITAANLGIQIAGHYRELGHPVNLDLVVAGILIHDIGKAWSYKLDTNGVWQHTNRSNMCHHIPIGHVELVKAIHLWNEWMLDEYIDEELQIKLEHIILSHHGHRAWSSPVIPQNAEAFIVHSVEMMDGYLEGKYFQGKVPTSIHD